MKYTLGVVVFCLCIVLGGGQHGLIGAFLLGLAIVLIDCLWLWQRYFQWCKTYPLKKSMNVVPGFIIRLFCVLVLLKIGQNWLSPHAFWICAAIVLTLPVWNIVSALLLKRKGFRNGTF